LSPFSKKRQSASSLSDAGCPLASAIRPSAEAIT
jgi:hypothetical protein